MELRTSVVLAHIKIQLNYIYSICSNGPVLFSNSMGCCGQKQVTEQCRDVEHINRVCTSIHTVLCNYCTLVRVFWPGNFHQISLDDLCNTILCCDIFNKTSM